MYFALVMQNISAKNILVSGLSLLLSLVALEIVSRKCLYVSEQWPNNSYWMQQKWLDNRFSRNENTTNYAIDTYDSLLGWKTKANLRNVQVSPRWSISTNSKAMRGVVEYANEKNGKLRIVTIGDSFTFGECVNDSETFAAQLEKLLDSAEVINLAVHGYGHDQQLLRLLHEGLPYKPDIVLLGFLNDDVARNELRFRDYAKPYFVSANEEIILKGVPVPSPQFYTDEFQLKSWALLRCAIIEQSYNGNGFVVSEVSEKILRKMVLETEASGAKFMSVYLPWQSECEQNDAGWHPLFDSLGVNSGVTLIDPTASIYKFLETEKNKNQHFSCHYSAEIHGVIAHTIAEVIRKKTTK